MIEGIDKEINNKLDSVIDLIKKGIVIKLYQSGSSMDEICKNLRMSKTVVVKMLKGVKNNKQK
jgi:hypothetical protein